MRPVVVLILSFCLILRLWVSMVLTLTSFLTPPVGFALFYLKGVCPPEIKLTDIYKGVVPFINFAIDWTNDLDLCADIGHLVASDDLWITTSNLKQLVKSEYI